MTEAKPCIKWIGGKTQIIETVLSKFPNHITNYHEPFLGGGSVLIKFLQGVKSGKFRVSGNVTACDSNETLIWMYKNIQNNSEDVIRELSIFEKEMKIAIQNSLNGKRDPSDHEEALLSAESYYYYNRSLYNRYSQMEKNSPRGSALFIFLNKTGFRGLHRIGPNGFNVPFGNYKNPAICESNNIRKLSQLFFESVEFKVQDYSDTLNNTVSGDFIYMDPPYVPEDKKSFVKYNVDGFDKESHQKLFEHCHILKSKNIQFILSNSNTTIVNEAFDKDEYVVEYVKCRRAINSLNPSAITTEVLIYPNKIV